MQPICEVMNAKLEQAGETHKVGNLSNVHEREKRVPSKAVTITLDDDMSECSTSNSFVSIH